MRTIALCVIAVVLASSAFLAADAQATGCATVTGGSLFATAAGCTDYMRCGTTFCGCINSRTMASPETCIANSNATCAETQRCLAAYAQCVEHPSSTAAGCAQLNTSIHMAQLVALGSGYSGSLLQRTCRHRVCTIMNGTSATCNFGVNDSAVCMHRPASTAAATTAMTNASTMASTVAMTNASVTTTEAGSTAPPTTPAASNTDSLGSASAGVFSAVAAVVAATVAVFAL